MISVGKHNHRLAKALFYLLSMEGDRDVYGDQDVYRCLWKPRSLNIW
jgi:hypothetical protein